MNRTAITLGKIFYFAAFMLLQRLWGSLSWFQILSEFVHKQWITRQRSMENSSKRSLDICSLTSYVYVRSLQRIIAPFIYLSISMFVICLSIYRPRMYNQQKFKGSSYFFKIEVHWVAMGTRKIFSKEVARIGRGGRGSRVNVISRRGLRKKNVNCYWEKKPSIP